VVSLKKEHYQHKSYGRIYTPVFEVVQWLSLDGNTEPEKIEEAAPAVGRRRRAAA
jgi:hypothetical protein